jgi:hypothetical protein
MPVALPFQVTFTLTSQDLVPAATLMFVTTVKEASPDPEIPDVVPLELA